MKLLRSCFLAVVLSLAASTAIAQKYAVHFTDKNDSPYSIANPEQFLSQRSIERRARLDIAIDVDDLPVNPAYVSGVEALGANVVHTSRWLNCALVGCTQSQANQISQLPYVSQVVFVSSESFKGKSRFANKLESEKDFIPIPKGTHKDDVYGEAYDQINQINGIPVHQQGFEGEGVLIAVIDAGFQNANTIGAFSHLYNSGRIVGVFNVVDPGGDIYASNTSNHGTNVLSCIGGHIEGQFRGTAPEASFALIRTEDAATELLVECYNWTIGAEYADSIGADIINTSLGYSEFDDATMDFQYSQMNGETAVSSIGAKKATEKGVFVTVSAGNSNGTSWPWVGTPSDVVNAATIGAVGSDGTIASFSSIGPNGAGALKPNVLARGSSAAVISTSGSVSSSSGTSFSSPIACGMYACLIQANPGVMPADLKDIVDQTGDRYPNHDVVYGYGIPDFAEALETVLNLGPVVFSSATIDDAGGNADGQLNPGESVTLDVALQNVLSLPVSNVTATLSCTNQGVNITQNTASFGSIGANGETNLSDAFAFTVSESIAPTTKLRFFLQITTSEGDCVSSFTLDVYGVSLNMSGYSIANDDLYPNGMLDPGETATLNVNVINAGNMSAQGVNAVLSTTSQLVVINDAEAVIGNIAGGADATGEFSITLNANASPENVEIPFTLTITHDNGQASVINFTYTNTCIITFDLHDSYGDGWNGAALRVSFDDGTPDQTLTIASGDEASFELEVSTGTTMSVFFVSGGYNNECSFDIYYQSNELMIYQSSGTPEIGTFLNMVVDCGASCIGVMGLSYNIVGTGEVSLSWTSAGNDVTEYQIFRDGTQIDVVNTNSYTETGLAMGDYVYCVRTVYNDGCVSSLSCIDVTVAEIFLMPETGTIEISTCTGVVYDNGGPDGQYSAQSSGIIVINPSNEGSLIRVSGYYSIEANYDFLKIYDGVGVDGTLLGSFTGVDGNEIEPLTSTEGSLTIQFSSDNSVQKDGFTLYVSCFDANLCYPATELNAEVFLYDIELSWQASETAESYTVYRDGIEVANGITTTQYTDADLSPQTQFCYQVKAICSNGDSELSQEVCATTSINGVSESNDTKLLLYPNPTNGKLMVKASLISGVMIYDMTGKVMRISYDINDSEAVIDTQNLMSGVYIIEVKHGNAQTTHSLFVVE